VGLFEGWAIGTLVVSSAVLLVWTGRAVLGRHRKDRHWTSAVPIGVLSNRRLLDPAPSL